MKKVKRFQKGGYEDTEDALNLLKAQAREDANFAEPGTESIKEFMKRTGTKANPPMARTYTSKGPVVTKEQMKKAGFDNLRDYLNAEKGLTRRVGKAPSKAEPSKAKATESSKSATDTGDESRRLLRRTGVFKKNPMTGEETVRDFNERIDPRFVNSMTYGRRAEMRMPTMKKGGVVKSSASKRADGIAIKGKTKGRFV